MSTVQTRPRRKPRPWLWALLTVLLGATLAGALLLHRPVSSAAQTKVETAIATQGTFRVSVTGPGTLAAHQTVDFKPQVQGTVLYLPKVGDRVSKGQLIVRIDPSSYQRAVDNAQLALEKAKAQLESARASQATGISSQQQAIASAQAAYTTALSQLENARASLAATQRVYAIGGATQQELAAAQRSLEQAQANAQSARVALEAARVALPLKQSGNAQDSRNLQLAVDQANLTLKNAQQDLANTKLYATFSGTVSAVNAQVGGVGVSASVSGSTALLTLIDDSSVDLPVQIDETEISQVKLGQKVDVTLDAFPDRSFTGTVTAITPSATVVQNIAIFYVTVNVPNPEHLLRPGMTAEGEILIQEIPSAVHIPKRAVQTVRTRSYVKVQKADGSTEERRITVGPDDGTNIVVRSGLQPGETVVVPARSAPSTRSNTVGFGGPPPGGP